MRWFDAGKGHGQIESEEFYDVLWVYAEQRARRRLGRAGDRERGPARRVRSTRSIRTSGAAHRRRRRGRIAARRSGLEGGMRMLRPRLLLTIVFAGLAASASAQQNRIDVVTPLAPELAAYGKYDIGVRTIQATDRNRPDVLNTGKERPAARYDRTLTLEVWYPATLAAGQQAGGDYRAITRDPAVTATLHGKAVRDAAPLTSAGAFPLVIISHGYPGNRYLLSHLGENLASKGFVVVSIDHKDSTYDDQKRFASTLYNRPFDQLFVLERDGAPEQRARQLSRRTRRRRAAPASSATRWAATAS